MFFETEPQWIEYKIKNKITDLSNNSETPNIVGLEKAFYYFDHNYISIKMKLNYIYTDTDILKNKIFGVDFIDANRKISLFKLQVNDSYDECKIEVIGNDGHLKSFIPVKITEPEAPDDNIKLSLLPTTLIKDYETREPLQLIHFCLEFQFPLKALYATLSITDFSGVNCFLKFYVQ